jgi:hypothetical protein
MIRSARWAWPLALSVLWLGGMVVYLAQQAEPVGRLQGLVVAEETGRPLPEAHVRLSAVSQPLVHDFYTRGDGRFKTDRIAAGEYQLTISSRAHRLGPVSVTVDEGVTKEIALELSPVSPFFELRAPWHTVTPDETPQVVANGFLVNQVLSFQFYRVDAGALFTKSQGSLYSLLHGDYQRQQWFIGGNPALTPVGEFSAPITRHDSEGLFRQRIDLPPLRGKPGIYLVVAHADSLRQLTWVTVTRLGLIVKQWGNDALSYVVDLKTGEPVPGASVQFALSAGRTFSGTTDRDGIFQVRLSPELPKKSESLVVRAEKDGSTAFLRTGMFEGTGEGQVRFYSYTDRPVYRPGHVVNFKGIARKFDDEKYAVPSQQPVEVEAWDSRETLIYKGRLTTDQFGALDGQFRLNDEAATGVYRLVSKMEGKPYESYFKVAEYRKPEYTVEVKPRKQRYVRGEQIDLEASAQYYFGAPVAGAQVNYQVFRTARYPYPRGEDEGEEAPGGLEERYLGTAIQQGATKTDEKGIAHITVRTVGPFAVRWEEEREEVLEDYDYRVEVTVTDPSRKQVTAQTSVLVTQGEFFLTPRPSRFIATPGQEVEVEVTAQDYDQHPVRGVRVAMTAGREIWSKGRSRAEEEAKGDVTTDDRGKAVFRFTPRRESDYFIKARSADRRGNHIIGRGFVWVTGAEYSDLQMMYPEMEIIADRPEYRRGETATLLVNSKFKGATALVTIEGPRLYEHRLVTLKGSSTRLTVPIKPEYAPNFFFSVALIRNKQFASQEKRIKVSVQERQLRVTVKPNKDRYAPSERATYQIATADWQGRPVPAELSMGVVDESIYAIEEDTTEPMLRFFYPQRENSVSTTYSFYQIYLDANKEPVNIKVRKRFPDTAYWNPRVITGADGRAQVSFSMPDTLTTWRATARAVTMDTAVGETVAKVKCSKDLLVRLEPPRFMTQGDRLTLSAIAHNYTKVKQAAAMWLQAPGLTFLGRPKSGEKQRFDLASDGLKRQDWQVEAPGPGAVPVTAYVQSDSGLSDAMELTLPVIPHGRERVEWRSGAVAGAVSEHLHVRQDSVSGASDLRVRLAPSLASVILGALDYLAGYPYGCAEQTMSAFLPDVVVARAMRELNLPNPQLEKRLPDMVQTGLNRLYGYQHGDGGWGWWRYDKSDPWMTAYVVFGLLTAKQNGFTVNEGSLNSGLHRLSQLVTPQPQLGQMRPGQVRAGRMAVGGMRPGIAQPGQMRPGGMQPGQMETGDTRDRAYALSVLALAGKDGATDEGLSDLYRRINQLDSYTIALLTSALLARGRDAEASIAADALWKKAHETQPLMYWKGADGYGRAGDTETTAVAFKALYALHPSDPRLHKAVRWLVLNREGNHWVSTRDTAFVIYALTDFLKSSQELRPDYQATVTVNGKPLATRRFTQADVFAPEVEVRVGGGSLPKGDNVLAIARQGRGNLYYTLILRQFVGGEDMTELVTRAGISVTRQYYRMQSERNPRTGEFTTAPAQRPDVEFKPGEAVLVRLTIRAPRQYEYVIVEDPIPAGCEVAEEPEAVVSEWDKWWSDMDVRDQKVAVFARRLPEGASTIEYHLRPQIPGDYHVMPTAVYSMYNPDLRGSGAEARVRLR